MAKQLRALVPLVEGQSLILGIRSGSSQSVYKSSCRGYDALSWSLQTLHGHDAQAKTQVKHPHT